LTRRTRSPTVGLDSCHRGVDGLHRGVDLAGGDAGQDQRELVLGGEGLLGDVEHTVHGAGDVEVGDGESEGAGELLGDGVQVRMVSSTAAWLWRTVLRR
jgi:hypothetical protein